MSSSRPVVWVSSVLYGAILVAGTYAGLAGLGDTRFDLFLAGLAALFALDVLERRRYPVRTPPGPAIALLAARLALFVVVAAADGSGLSRALLVLVPFTAYFAFGRITSIALGVACVGLVVLSYELSIPRWYADAEQVSDLLMFCVGLVLTIAMAAVAVQEQRGRARLEQSHEQLAAYAAQVAELSATAERNRVARDIHDGLGHHLTAIAVLLEKAAAFRDRDPAAADRAIDDAHRSARRALDDVRQSVSALRAEAAPFSLSAALADLIRQVGDAEPQISLDLDGDESGHDLAGRTALFRAAQEALTNSLRHAGATRVALALRFDDAVARLVVADDGRGFRPERAGFGLLGMRERVQLVGGRMEVDSQPDAGTRITVTIPRRPVAVPPVTAVPAGTGP
ncbi:MAG TPA: sensor histidine kinase [Pilimelia sp.]|nr:sensor histidine kinase [Pilimelia sp.]